MHKVLVIVGMAGSGKGTITDYLESVGMPKVYFGGMVYEEVEKRGLDIVQHEREVREDMRLKDGLDVLAKRASAKADEYFAQGKEVVVFDGLYSWSEYKYIEQKYGEDALFIAVFTPKNIRYERASNRRESHRSYTVEDIKKRDHEEIEGIEKGGPIAMADYTLVNTKTPDDLITELKTLLVSLGIQP